MLGKNIFIYKLKNYWLYSSIIPFYCHTTGTTHCKWVLSEKSVIKLRNPYVTEKGILHWADRQACIWQSQNTIVCNWYLCLLKSLVPLKEVVSIYITREMTDACQLKLWSRCRPSLTLMVDSNHIHELLCKLKWRTSDLFMQRYFNKGDSGLITSYKVGSHIKDMVHLERKFFIML